MSDLFCAANAVVAQDAAAVPAGERFAAVWCSTGIETTARAAAEQLGLPLTVRPELGGGSGLVTVLQELADQFRGETVLLVVEGAEQSREIEAAVPAVEGLQLGIRR